ncbi:hypothetical protein H0H92_002683 [Tricholoma furcatifolium]|nr:hypothetical protein H0H92_002683 [Tricholoma furcatifolium]
MPASPLKTYTTGVPLKSTPKTRHTPAKHYSSYLNSSDEGSDDESSHSSLFTPLSLRASIASVSATKLREILVRLVDRSPGLQYAVAKELASPTTESSSSSRSPRRKRRRPGRRSLDVQAAKCSCENCGRYVNDGDISETCCYHPGTLQGEIYEFPSRTPEGHAFQVTRKIFMWSCCDEDAENPGCTSAPAHLHARPRPRASTTEGQSRSSLRTHDRLESPNSKAWHYVTDLNGVV